MFLDPLSPVAYLFRSITSGWQGELFMRLAVIFSALLAVVFLVSMFVHQLLQAWDSWVHKGKEISHAS
jgi:hypothetical protein